MGDGKGKDREGPDFSDEKEILKFTRGWKWLSLGGSMKIVQCNWVVSCLATLILFTFVGVSLGAKGCDDADDDIACRSQAEFGAWQTWITQNFTWLYIGTQDVWCVFVAWLCVSKYGTLKLGKKDEKPEFGNISWFAMLFACGLGTGIWYWGVSEPIYYYRDAYSSGIEKPGYFNDDQKAQQALFITMFHWGIHGWVCYIVIALLLAFISYRWDMPMTMRMCFFPLIGDKVFGLFGDFIDALSIACTTFGVCTSLGLGVMIIHSGLRRLDCSDENGMLKKKLVDGTYVDDCAIPNSGDEGKNWDIAIIWLITLIATISVISGLHRGIKWLSIITFMMGCGILAFMTLQDNTWYIMNVFVQSIGYYFQYIIQIGHETDAFSQLNYEFKPAGKANIRSGIQDFDYAEDGGNANQLWGSVGKTYDIVTEAIGHDLTGNPTTFYEGHNKRWIDWWTIFYWGWWISWGPFVGMFIAKISRGRTIREVIIGAFLAPTMYTFYWLSCMGGLGIKMQRVAELALLPANATETGLLNTQTGKVDCAYMGYVGKEPAYGTPAWDLAKAGYYALGCRNSDDRVWDVMMPYGVVWKFLLTVSLICVIFYFITSSDSGSFIDDTLSAGGLEDPPALQKVYWCCTEGACATALLYAGGNSALKALQAVSIVAGMPYTFVICFACTSLWIACKKDFGDEDIVENSGDFRTHVLDPFDMLEMFELGGASYMRRSQALLRGLFAPFLAIYPAAMHCFSHMNKMVGMAVVGSSAVCFLLWIIMQFVAMDYDPGYSAANIGWMFYLIFTCIVASLRQMVREEKKIYGSILQDWFTTFILFPCVCAQLELEFAPVS